MLRDAPSPSRLIHDPHPTLNFSEFHSHPPQQARFLPGAAPGWHRLPGAAGSRQGERGHQPWGSDLPAPTSSDLNIRENLQGLVPFQPSRALTAVIIIVVVVIVTKHSHTAIKYKLDNTRSWPEELRLQTGWTVSWIPPEGWARHSPFPAIPFQFPSQFLPGGAECWEGKGERTRSCPGSSRYSTAPQLGTGFVPGTATRDWGYWGLTAGTGFNWGAAAPSPGQAGSV